MKSEWKKVKLGDICVLNYGKSLPSNKREKGVFPVYSSSGCTGFHNQFLHENKGIIIGRKGNVGTIFKSDEPFFAIDTAYYILPNENLYNFDYLFYALQTIGLNKLNSDSAVPGLNRNTAYAQNLNLPPISEQKAIADILSALDDKIELNNKINKNLKEQTQALFKHWFIDFEFPDENGYPYKSSGGKMKPSELGDIPEGWDVKSIYNFADIIYGAPFASNKFNNEQKGKPIIRIRDLPTQHSEIYTDEIHSKGYLLQKGDIVVGMDGEFRAYIWHGFECWLNQRLCVFKEKENISKAFLFYSILPLLSHIEKTEVATTVIHIGKNDFDRFMLTSPQNSVSLAFKILTDKIIYNIILNNNENQKLAEIRDYLLPKLMSGVIKII